MQRMRQAFYPVRFAAKSHEAAHFGKVAFMSNLWENIPEKVRGPNPHGDTHDGAAVPLRSVPSKVQTHARLAESPAPPQQSHAVQVRYVR